MKQRPKRTHVKVGTWPAEYVSLKGKLVLGARVEFKRYGRGEKAQTAYVAGFCGEDIVMLSLL